MHDMTHAIKYIPAPLSTTYAYIFSTNLIGCTRILSLLEGCTGQTYINTKLHQVMLFVIMVLLAVNCLGGGRFVVLFFSKC